MPFRGADGPRADTVAPPGSQALGCRGEAVPLATAGGSAARPGPPGVGVYSPVAVAPPPPSRRGRDAHCQPLVVGGGRFLGKVSVIPCAGRIEVAKSVCWPRATE